MKMSSSGEKSLSKRRETLHLPPLNIELANKRASSPYELTEDSGSDKQFHFTINQTVANNEETSVASSDRETKAQKAAVLHRLLSELGLNKDLEKQPLNKDKGLEVLEKSESHLTRESPQSPATNKMVVVSEPITIPLSPVYDRRNENSSDHHQTQEAFTKLTYIPSPSAYEPISPSYKPTSPVYSVISSPPESPFWSNRLERLNQNYETGSDVSKKKSATAAAASIQKVGAISIAEDEKENSQTNDPPCIDLTTNEKDMNDPPCIDLTTHEQEKDGQVCIDLTSEITEETTDDQPCIDLTKEEEDQIDSTPKNHGLDLSREKNMGCNGNKRRRHDHPDTSKSKKRRLVRKCLFPEVTATRDVQQLRDEVQSYFKIVLQLAAMCMTTNNYLYQITKRNSDS